LSKLLIKKAELTNIDLRFIGIDKFSFCKEQVFLIFIEKPAFILKILRQNTLQFAQRFAESQEQKEFHSDTLRLANPPSKKRRACASAGATAVE
jgi:hypothetical protein